jgi:hypothetical protein
MKKSRCGVDDLLFAEAFIKTLESLSGSCFLSHETGLLTEACVVVADEKHLTLTKQPVKSAYRLVNTVSRPYIPWALASCNPISFRDSVKQIIAEMQGTQDGAPARIKVP